MNYLLINVRKDIEETKTELGEIVFGNLLRIVDIGEIDDSTIATHHEDNSITSWRWRYHLKDDIKKIFEDAKSDYNLIFDRRDRVESNDLIFRLYSSNKEALTMIKLMMNY